MPEPVTASRLRLPHPLILLLGCLAVSAAASWIAPAGRYERRDDEVLGRTVVVPGTYHRVDPAPLGPFAAAMAVPKGLADAAAVVFLVFLVGGAFAVVEQTGALGVAVGGLVARLAGRRSLVIPLASVAFAAGGATMNMQEEIIAFVPLLLLLVRRLGFDPLTSIAMSVGAAGVGAAFSPINPFQAGIAQQIAQLPPLSGGGFRTVFMVLAVAIWIGGTMRHAARSRGPAGDADRFAAEGAPEAMSASPAARRPAVVLGLVALAFTLLVYGMLELEWGFTELSAIFFVMGLAAGLVAGFGWSGTAEAFVAGFRAMAGAALVVGFARAIYIALDEGRILDTMVHAMFTPLEHLPLAVSAIGMMAAHTLIHIPVPSVSGQAVLTIPILVPLSDLLHLSRQVTVLAYQYGGGLCDILTPTNGALMAILAAAGVPFDRWLRFTLPLWAALFGLGTVAVMLGIAIGL
jgi:uncharacterized ion transporter superfamily protein YfcC